MSPADLSLAACILLAAALYTSVGHAGASAYLAIMALFGVAPSVMRPTALVLNIIVSCFTSYRYWHAGLFRWRTLWPFLIGAVPAGFIGGALHLPTQIYRPVVGVVLFVAAARLLWSQDGVVRRAVSDPPVLTGVVYGAAIGLLSGLTGTGGGIFLSPLLLFMGWSETRMASGVASVFILAISVAGLSGNLSSVRGLPPDLMLFVGAVMLGAIVGTTLGTKRFATSTILRALGVVLVIAGFKLVGLY